MLREQNNIFVIKILAEKNSFGALSKYANKNLIPLESTAWQNSAVEKYIKNFLDSADVNFKDIENNKLPKCDIKITSNE